MSQLKNCPSDEFLADRALSYIAKGKRDGWVEAKAVVREILTRRIIHEQQHNSSGGEHMVQTLKAIRAEVERL